MSIGIVGTIVPILLTTPILLWATFLCARSSERLYGGLLNNRLVGGYLHNDHEGHGMSRGHKIATPILPWSVYRSTAVLAVQPWWLRCLLGSVGIDVTAEILTLPEGQRTTG